MKEERRRNVRTQLGSEIQILSKSGAKSGKIVNLSKRGMLLKTSLAVEKGVKMRLRGLWPPGRHCEAHGTVTRRDGDRLGLSLDDWNEGFEQLMQAIEFCETSEEAREVWGTLISCAIDVRE
jgi:hypothetical protein